jgi:hypothetical protein
MRSLLLVVGPVGTGTARTGLFYQQNRNVIANGISKPARGLIRRAKQLLSHIIEGSVALGTGQEL